MSESIEVMAQRMGNERDFAGLFALAYKVGMKAGSEMVPVPMSIVEADVFGKPLPGAKVYVCDEGPCGFAWVKIFPGNCPAANAAKKMGIARKAYGGGVEVWVSEFGQSVDRKEAFANAYARVLQFAGIKAYGGSRLD